MQTPVLFAAVSASVFASIAIDHDDDVDVEVVTDDDEADGDDELPDCSSGKYGAAGGSECAGVPCTTCGRA